ncbi:hypothetical protein WDZ92_40660, partial [Nostoc sp. NIES-2111]
QDEELIEMLSAAGELTGAHPLAIITTARPGGDRAYDALRGSQHGVPLVTLDLGPMRAEDALELANTAEDVSDLVRRRCLERSAGNPLYLEQLLRNAEELTHSDVPASLRGLILARVDRLPAPDKRALHAAAILGQRFDSDALSHLLGTSSFDPSNLTRTGLLKAGSDGLAFGHALIRDAVLRSLLAEQRRSLHARAAQWYAQRDLILHAAHLQEAGDPGAAAAFRRAAEDRLARYRSSEALELVDRGLACSDGESEAPRLMLLKAETLLECGRASDAATAFRATIDLGPEATIECRCRLGLAAAYRIMDDIELALAELDRAEELAHEIERHDLLSQCHHLRGNLLFPTGRMQECWTEHQLALEAAEQAGDPEAKARALGGL